MNQNLGSFHQGNVNIFDRGNKLKPRNFMGSLFQSGTQKCIEYLGDGIKNDAENLKFCRNELMVASSCVLLNKVDNQMGDNRDNVGLCKYEVKIVREKLKERFSEFPTNKMDEWLRDLSFSTKSFC